MNQNQKLEILASIFNMVQDKFDKAESETLKQISNPKHQNHILFQLYQKGTKNDKLKALSELIEKEKNLVRFCFKNLFGMIDNKQAKKNHLIYKIFKDLTIKLFGKFSYKKNNKILFEDFKDLLFKQPDIIKSFRNANLQQSQIDQLIDFYYINFVKSRIQKFAEILQHQQQIDLKILQKENNEILIELTKKTIKKVALLFAPILINKLGEKNKFQVNSISKTISILINNELELSMDLVNLIIEFINRQNQTETSKKNAIELLSSLNFTSIEDKSVNHTLFKFFINGIQQFIQSLLTERDHQKKFLLKEKFGKEKIKKKNVKVTLKNLIKEKIERNTKMLNHYIRGINKIMPTLKNMDAFKDFFDNNLVIFFKFCRISTHKLSIQILTFLFQIFKYDYYSKLMERYLNLFYDLINSVDFFTNAVSEQIFDLLYNALKNDHEFKRICSFIKRLFVVLIHSEPNIIIGLLVFFAKFVEVKPGLKILLQNQTQEIEQKTIGDQDTLQLGYDAQKRNPLYTNADQEQLWELIFLRNHQNQLVRKFSILILNQKFDQIKYKGNPLIDFSNLQILQRFSLMPARKPRDNQKTRRKYTPQITYDNYKKILSDDDKSLQIYFQQREKQLEYAKKKQKKETVQVTEEDIDRNVKELDK